MSLSLAVFRQAGIYFVPLGRVTENDLYLAKSNDSMTSLYFSLSIVSTGTNFYHNCMATFLAIVKSQVFPVARFKSASILQ